MFNEIPLASVQLSKECVNQKLTGKWKMETRLSSKLTLPLIYRFGGEIVGHVISTGTKGLDTPRMEKLMGLLWISGYR